MPNYILCYHFEMSHFKEKGDVSALEKCACTATEIQQCRLYFLAVLSSSTQQNKNMWDQEFKS